MLSQSCDAIVVGVVKSTLEHDSAGTKYFARERFEKRVVIGYYSSMEMYTSLYGDKYVEKGFEERVMAVSIEEIQNFALHISRDMTDSNGKS